MHLFKKGAAIAVTPIKGKRGHLEFIANPLKRFLYPYQLVEQWQQALNPQSEYVSILNL